MSEVALFPGADLHWLHFSFLHGNKATSGADKVSSLWDTVHEKGRGIDHVRVIGTSLSEPHTSVTAFPEVVCMSACLWPYTVNLK